jgi:hypothetical protein
MQTSPQLDTLAEAMAQLLEWEKQGYNAFTLSTEYEDNGPVPEESPAEDAMPIRLVTDSHRAG